MSYPTQSEGRLLNLLISALGLLIATLVLGLGILTVMSRPDWFTPSPTPIIAAVDTQTSSEPEVVDGIDVATGFIAEGDYLLVKSTCTACHSSKLVTQNRATRDGWEDMIRWMQRTQKLWDLGENEAKILDYLATHYGPEDQGRRAPIEIDNWFAIPVEAPPRGAVAL